MNINKSYTEININHGIIKKQQYTLYIYGNSQLRLL